MKKTIYSVFVTLGLILPSTVFSQSVILNGSFEQDFTNWLNLTGTGTAAFTISNDKTDGNQSMKVEVTSLGTNPWDIQSINSGWNANRGKEYKITLQAKAALAGASIKLVNQDTSYNEQTLTLTTDWKEYTWIYTPVESSLQFKIQYPQLGTFYVDNIKIIETTPTPFQPAKDSLKTLAAKCGISFGTAVADGPLQTEANYKKTLKQQYSIVTPENVMKMEVIKPKETGAYDFAAADTLVDFALANKIKVRGHTLVWHSQLPQWLTTKTWTRETLLAYLKDYITTVVGRYKGKIAEWDVANEFFSDDAGNPLRNNSIWLNTIGADVLDSAFKWTHAVDPNAKLFYNDYSAETMNAKSNMVYNLVKGLKQRGAPINGVGFQLHVSYNENANFTAALDQNIKRLAALGLKVSFTEVDLYQPLPATTGNNITQGHTYAEILRVALNNKNTIETFVTWGFSDKYSWIPDFYKGVNGDALPFDANYNAKPAFDSLVSVLNKNCNIITALEPFATNIESEINSFPNPFTDNLVLQLKGQFDYTVYNITGDQVYGGQGLNSATFGKELKPGLYSIQTSDFRKVIKVIKAER